MQTNAVPATLLPLSRERQDLPPAATCRLSSCFEFGRGRRTFFGLNSGSHVHQKKPYSMLHSILSMKNALKRLCAILLVGLLFSLTALGQPAFLKEGLLAYYPFNGNANDESGNGRHGTLVAGAQIVQDRFVQSRSAVHLNGIDGFISLRANSLTLKTNSFLDVSGTNARTFSLWAKLDAFRTPGFGVNPILTYGLAGYPNSSYRGATFSMHFDNYDPAEVQVAFWAHLIDLKFNKATTNYMHHVVTYDGQRIDYYLDGTHLGAIYAKLNTADDKISLGGGPDSENPDNRFLGNIDDVRIYNRALSAAEVAELYKYESVPLVTSSYQNIDGRFTWQQAKEDAMKRGGHLATITTVDEQVAVMSLGISSWYWLGGTDSNIEGQWNWITGEPFTYSNWAEGEPNNAGGAENYLMIGWGGVEHSFSQWNDGPNAPSIFTSGYILEIPNKKFSPVFKLQPGSKTVNTGENVVLSVALQSGGTYNYHFQWQLNEQNIAGATTSSLSVNNAVAGVYKYRVIVSNSAGTVISDTATLTVVTPPAPSIATQPAAKTVQEGSNISFNVVASSTLL